MDTKMVSNEDVLFTFLQDVKDGKYAEIDINTIEMPRLLESRDEFMLDDDIPILFSVTNQI